MKKLLLTLLLTLTLVGCGNNPHYTNLQRIQTYYDFNIMNCPYTVQEVYNSENIDAYKIEIFIDDDQVDVWVVSQYKVTHVYTYEIAD